MNGGAPVALTAAEVADIVRRVCTRKRRFPVEWMARRTARRARARGEQITHYRCPFPDPGDRHWHIGHPPSIESVARIAQAIRARHQGPT